MGQEYEVIGYPKLRHVRIFIDEVRYRSQHLHADYEFCLALKGSANFHTLITPIEVHAGSLLFLNSNEVHSIRAENEPFLGLFLQISIHFLRDYLPELHTKDYRSVDLSTLLPENVLLTIRAEIMAMSSSYFAKEEGYRLKTYRTILDLMDLLQRHVPYDNLKEKDIIAKKRNAKRIGRITAYIDQNLEGKIALREIAESEGLSSCHLSHLFSTSLGITFQDYVNQRRLERAISLIQIPEKRVTDIAYECGFSDPKYMTNMFRKQFGCTPNEFRHKDMSMKIASSSQDQAILEHIYSDEEALTFLKSYPELG